MMESKRRQFGRASLGCSAIPSEWRRNRARKKIRLKSKPSWQAASACQLWPPPSSSMRHQVMEGLSGGRVAMSRQGQELPLPRKDKREMMGSSRSPETCVDCPYPAHDVKALCQRGRVKEALNVVNMMEQGGIAASAETFGCLLQACTNMKLLREARQVHALIRRSSFKSNSCLGNSMVNMYVKCGDLVNAVELFNQLSERTVTSWTAVISGYTMNGQAQEALKVYSRMQQEGKQPDRLTLVSVLKACGSTADLEEGKQAHAKAVQWSWETDLFVGTSLVDMYAKCGSMVDAQLIFARLPQRDVVSWNAMIGGYAHQGSGEQALQLYSQMLQSGLTPSHRTFPSVLKACGSLSAAEKESLVDGQQMKAKTWQVVLDIHAEVARRDCESDIFVGNSLVDAYSKCGDMVNARKVFDRLVKRDVVSWNALVAGYATQDEGAMAVQLYSRMKGEGVRPDSWTFGSLLKACCSMAGSEEGKRQSLQVGEEIHADLIKLGLESHVLVANALVHMYAKCGDVAKARRVFDSLSKRDVVTWTAMIAGYVQDELGEAALQLYSEMLEEGTSPNNWTYVSALKACSLLASKEKETVSFTDKGRQQVLRVESLRRGKSIHDEIEKSGYEVDVYLSTALVDMYAKCGDLEAARRLFDSVERADVVTWNSMIAGYAHHDDAEAGAAALHLYAEMQEARVRGNEATFISLLKVCGNTGALAMCRQLHLDMVESGVERNTSVATSLIHAYGKCSCMEEAQRVFDTFPDPDIAAWNVLIAGYARQGDGVKAQEQFRKMEGSGAKPNGVTFLHLLSACSHAGMVDAGLGFLEDMRSEYGISPSLQHFTSLVDLLGRAGRLDTAMALLAGLPVNVQPDLALWLSVLVACRNHGNVRVGEMAFRAAVMAEPQHAAAYLLMAGVYAQQQMPDQAAWVETMRQNAGAWKRPGQSWIEVENGVHMFAAGEKRHPQIEQVLAMVREVSAGVVGAVGS